MQENADQKNSEYGHFVIVLTTPGIIHLVRTQSFPKN